MMMSVVDVSCLFKVEAHCLKMTYQFHNISEIPTSTQSLDLSNDHML
jgi:hypothetical protein